MEQYRDGGHREDASSLVISLKGDVYVWESKYKLRNLKYSVDRAKFSEVYINSLFS